MTTKVSPRERARTLEHSATSGPWASCSGWGACVIYGPGDRDDEGILAIDVTCSDAEFVVAARNAYPAFLKLWEHAAATIWELNELLSLLHEYIEQFGVIGDGGDEEIDSREAWHQGKAHLLTLMGTLAAVESEFSDEKQGS